MTITAIDISMYQGNPDFAALKNGGVNLVICKATDGTGWIDPDFNSNWAGMKSQGMQRGAYHFAEPTSGTPEGQAQHFWSTVSAQGFDATHDLLALDLEVDGGTVAWAQAFLTELGKLAGSAHIGFYSGANYINTTLGGGVGLGSWFLWIAAYQNNEPLCPAGWNHITIWQNYDAGTVSGINGQVDTDIVENTSDLDVSAAMANTPKAVAAALNGSMTGVWVAASDGGVFTYGKAQFFGSLGGKPLAAPIVDILAYEDSGYYLLGADGGVFTFGNAPFKGSYPGLPASAKQGTRTFLTMVYNSLGGYSLLADDGSHYEFH